MFGPQFGTVQHAIFLLSFVQNDHFVSYFLLFFAGCVKEPVLGRWTAEAGASIAVSPLTHMHSARALVLRKKTQPWK